VLSQGFGAALITRASQAIGAQNPTLARSRLPACRWQLEPACVFITIH
jgi:hypothetical protein